MHCCAAEATARIRTKKISRNKHYKIVFKKHISSSFPEENFRPKYFFYIPLTFHTHDVGYERASLYYRGYVRMAGRWTDHGYVYRSRAGDGLTMDMCTAHAPPKLSSTQKNTHTNTRRYTQTQKYFIFSF